MLSAFLPLVMNTAILQVLKVYHTPIEYIDNMAFIGILNLESVTIGTTGLTTMPPLDPVKGSILFLYLFENSISFVPSFYFNGFNSLQVLNLRRNFLHIFPDVTSLSYTLVHLDFNYNRINSIPRTFYITKFLHLEKLLLYSNHIPTFDYEGISSWPKLNYLELGINNITNLPDMRNQYNNCSTILRRKCLVLLFKNPIDCNGTSSATVSHIVKQSINPIIMNCFMLIQPKDIRCASPPHLCGRILHNLSK